MSLTSYRAAPPRVIKCEPLRPGSEVRPLFSRNGPDEVRSFKNRLIIDFRPNGLLRATLTYSLYSVFFRGCRVEWSVLYGFEKMIDICVLSRPGSDLLSRVLRQSTIGAGAFHGRVRNGIGCSRSAITTRSAKNTNMRSCCLSCR